MSTHRAHGGTERRARLLAELESASAPLRGSELSTLLGVSRQIVVADVAILRAAGASIIATPQGYLSAPAANRTGLHALIASRHAPAESERELRALVACGVRVVDVVVEHSLYGELRGQLNLASQHDVSEWLVERESRGAHLLSELTEGLHLHTLEAPSEAALEAAKAALRTLGFLVEA
ncbi:transcription repressor NadR [bacterium]|nr:MAG: transcription repressor NadR [bacterium]